MQSVSPEPIISHFYLNVHEDIFCNVRYHVTGPDPHLGKIHTHAGLEILYVNKGHGTYMIGNSAYRIYPNCVFLINGSSPHAALLEGISDYMRSSVIFSESFAVPLLEYLHCTELLEHFFSSDLSGCCCRLPDNAAAQLDRYFMELKQVSDCSGTPFRLAKMSQNFISILLLIYQMDHISETPHQNDKSFRKSQVIMRYIDDHLSDFSLDRMSSDLFLSKSYLCHCFKDTTAMTISDYVKNKRINMAKYLLLTADIPISEIASAVGFCNFSFFSNSFKKVEGMTPSEYRANNRTFQIK